MCQDGGMLCLRSPAWDSHTWFRKAERRNGLDQATFGWGRGAMWLLSWSLLPPSGCSKPPTSRRSIWACPGIADAPSVPWAPPRRSAVSAPGSQATASLENVFSQPPWEHRGLYGR